MFYLKFSTIFRAPPLKRATPRCRFSISLNRLTRELAYILKSDKTIKDHLPKTSKKFHDHQEQGYYLDQRQSRPPSIILIKKTKFIFLWYTHDFPSFLKFTINHFKVVKELMHDKLNFHLYYPNFLGPGALVTLRGPTLFPLDHINSFNFHNNMVPIG